jgi:hypothetical protein
MDHSIHTDLKSMSALASAYFKEAVFALKSYVSILPSNYVVKQA